MSSLRASRSTKKKKPEVRSYPDCLVRNCKSCGFFRGVSLGRYHEYRAFLVKPAEPREGAILHVGCRRFKSAQAASRHWANGTNPRGYPRPRAKELIAKAAATAKQLRWRWGRAAKGGK
jgi:hypothetical protein